MAVAVPRWSRSSLVSSLKGGAPRKSPVMHGSLSTGASCSSEALHARFRLHVSADHGLRHSHGAPHACHVDFERYGRLAEARGGYDTNWPSRSWSHHFRRCGGSSESLEDAKGSYFRIPKGLKSTQSILFLPLCSGALSLAAWPNDRFFRATMQRPQLFERHSDAEGPRVAAFSPRRKRPEVSTTRYKLWTIIPLNLWGAPSSH